METVRTNIENFIKNGDLQNAIYLLIENTTTINQRNYLCTLLGDLTRTEHGRHLIPYDDYNRVINRITNSLLDLLSEIELTKTAKTVKKGYAVHNIPSSMTLGKKILCEVKISDAEINIIKSKFKKIFEDVYLRDEMEVILTSTDEAFTIEPLNSNALQSVLSGEINSWKFWLTGNKDGKHELILKIAGYTNDILNKTKKREDITVVKIAVTMSKGQNLDPECALPYFIPTNIYYGQRTTARQLLASAVKVGAPQIAIILGVVFFLFSIPKQPSITSDESNVHKILIPDNHPFNTKGTKIDIVGADNAKIVDNEDGQHVLVVDSEDKEFESYLSIRNSISSKYYSIYEIEIDNITQKSPNIHLKFLDSTDVPIDSLLILKLPDECSFYSPKVFIGNTKHLNWKVIDDKTIILKGSYSAVKQNIIIVDTAYENGKIKKVLISTPNLSFKEYCKYEQHFNCPVPEEYRNKQVSLVLKDFTKSGGKIVNDTNQFKLMTNGKISKVNMFINDTLKQTLSTGHRYSFNIVYKSPQGFIIKSIPLDTFLLDYTKRIVLSFDKIIVDSKLEKDTLSTIVLRFPDKFFKKPILTLNNGKNVTIATINNNSLKILLPRNKDFKITAKEDNHKGYVQFYTKEQSIQKDFNCESIPYQIRFKLSNKLRHLHKNIAVIRKNGEIDMRFDKDYCTVKFWNANKVDGFENIELFLKNDDLLICRYKGKLNAGQVKEWDCGEFCRTCQEEIKAQAQVKQNNKSNK